MTVAWPACWEADTDWLIRPDVAERLDQTLLATHVAPVILPIAVPGEGAAYRTCVDAAIVGERRLSQDDLLDRLLAPVETGNRIVAVLGGPGTGKSHIIRWIQHRLPKDDRYVVRHVPKSQTSIAQVVERLLEGMEGPDVDDLREKLASARKGDLAEPERLARRLAAEVAILLQEHAHQAIVWQGKAAGLDRDKLDWLCSPGCLPNLLKDLEPNSYLTAEGGALWRVARQMLEGTREGHEDEGLRVEPGDLDMRTAIALDDANIQTKSFVRKLASDASRAEAAAVINSVIDHAALGIMGITSTSLKELVRQFRAHLKSQGRELVLLFEDLAIASGIRRDLIDVLETPATERGENEICDLRVAFAVTPAYWESSFPQTLTQRISQWESEAYSLDLPDEESQRVAIGVYVRNMNAARLGRAKVEGMLPEDAAEGVDNACLSCPLQEECWPLFGTVEVAESGERYGAFPLRSERLPSIVSALAAEGGLIRNRLVLRQIAGGVLRSRLGERRDFPSEDLTRSLERSGDHVSAETQSAIRNLASSDESAEDRLIAAWQLAEPLPNAPTREKLYSALGVEALAAVAGSQTAKTPESSGSSESTTTSKPAAGTSELHKQLAEVDAWANRQTLPAAIAQLVRESINQIVGHSIDLDDYGLRAESCLELIGHKATQSGKLLPDTSIDIAKSAGGGQFGGRRAAATKPLISLDPRNDAVLVKALLRQWYVYRDEPRLAAARQLAEQSCVEDEALVAGFIVDLRQKIVQLVEKTGTKSVEEAARTLSLTGRVLGIEVDGEPDPNWRRFLIEADDDAGRGLPEDIRASARAVHSSALASAAAVIGRSQGGATTPTAIVPSVLNRSVQVSLGADDEGKSGVGNLVRSIRERATELRERAQSAAAVVRAELYRDEELDDLSAVIAAVAAAANDAFRAGVVTSPDAKRRSEAFHDRWTDNGQPKLTADDLDRCEALGTSDDDLAGIIKVLSAHDLIETVGEVSDYLLTCRQWIAPALRAVGEQDSGEPGNHTLGTATALADLQRDVEAALRLVQGVAEGVR